MRPVTSIISDRDIQELFPGGTTTAVIQGDEARLMPLHPSEEPTVSHAVPSRRWQFQAGRHCARLALRDLGLVNWDTAIPQGEAGSPRWPDGVVGSITHCEGFVAAVTARRDEFRGLGIDAEGAVPLPPDVAERVCLDDELRAIEHAPLPVPAAWDTVVFSGKEAVHKCCWPLIREVLEFTDVRLTLSAESRTFRAESRRGASQQIPSVEGRFIVTSEHVVCSAYLLR